MKVRYYWQWQTHDWTWLMHTTHTSRFTVHTHACTHTHTHTHTHAYTYAHTYTHAQEHKDKHWYINFIHCNVRHAPSNMNTITNIDKATHTHTHTHTHRQMLTHFTHCTVPHTQTHTHKCWHTLQCHTQTNSQSTQSVQTHTLRAGWFLTFNAQPLVTVVAILSVLLIVVSSSQ